MNKQNLQNIRGNSEYTFFFLLGISSLAVNS